MFKNLANLAGLGNLGGLTNLMSNAHEIGGKMEQITERLRQARVVAHSGGGMVTVELNGMGQMLKLVIEPSLVERQDREMIEDLVPAAVNEAIRKAKELHMAEMKSMTDSLGFDFPGLESALSKLTGTGV